MHSTNTTPAAANTFRTQPVPELQVEAVQHVVDSLEQRYDVLRSQGITLKFSGQQVLRFATVIFLCQMLAKDVAEIEGQQS